MTAPIDAPSPGLGLFDRLAGDAAAAATNGAERSNLRPLLPHHAAFLNVRNIEDDGPLDATVPSRGPPMQHQPRVPRLDLATEVPRMSEAPAGPLRRDAAAAPAQRVASESKSANVRDPTPIVIRTRPSLQSTPPGQPGADTPAQARSTALPDLWATDTAAPVPRPAVLDSTVHSEPHRDHPLAAAMPRPQAVAEHSRAALRSRDTSLVSPLPRPAPWRAEPTIEIHIGRIEVRAQTAASPPAAPAPRAAAPSASALAAHLGARGRGARS